MADMQQSLRQASVRAVTGTTHTYEGDWHALWDSMAIAAGDFNGRMLQYINTRLASSYTEINGAMAAMAAAEGVDSFQAIGTFTANLNKSVAADAGSYVVTGTAATLTVIPARTISAAAGSYAVTGTAATLTDSGGGAGAFDVSHLTALYNTTDTNTWTFSTVSLGDADAGRTIVVSVLTVKANPAATISSVTVGGVSATLISGATTTLDQGGATHVMSMYEAAVPTGTTGDIVVTTSDTTLRCAIKVDRVISGTSSSGQGANVGANTTVSVTVVIPTGGVGLYYAYEVSSTGFSAWTNLTTEDFDTAVEGTRTHSGGRRTTAGSTAVSANVVISTSIFLVGCAFGP